MSHLWIGDRDSAGVLVIAKPAVLYGVDLGVIGFYVSQVLPVR